MRHFDILIIGGVAAGTKIAAKSRRENLDCSIGLLTEDDDISYAGCGLPYYLGGVIQTRRQLVVRKPEQLKELNNVDVMVKHHVSAIDTDAHTVTVTNMEANEEETIGYGKLALATGAKATRPPIPGIDLQGIHTLRSVTDADHILELIQNEKIDHVVIVGGGFIGIEVAENLTHKGIGSTVVEMLPQILPPFDKDIARNLEKQLRANNVTILTGAKVEAFEGDNGSVSRVKTTKGTIRTDLVLLSIGVSPSSELAKVAGVKTGIRGTIKTDPAGRTNIPDVYAAGDCTATVNTITGKEAWIPMGSTANKQARATAITLAGGEDKFPGTLGTTVVKVFDLSAGRTGLGEEEAREAGFDPISTTVTTDDKAHYYPGSAPIHIKLIADKQSGRLLGGQAFGRGVIDKPIDVLVTALSLGAKAEDLAKMDFAYAPPFSTAINPVNLAATVLNSKMTGKMQGISASELHERLNDTNWDGMVLDIREIPEHMISAIPGSKNIQFTDLAEKAHEIDTHKDKEVVLICGLGRRAFEAYLRVKKLGFEKAMILEGGLKAWPYEVE